MPTRRLLLVIAVLLGSGGVGVVARWHRVVLEWERVQRSYRDAGMHVTDVRLETIATGLHTVWDLEFLGPDRLLAVERHGRIRLIERQRLDPNPYHVFADASPGQHLGLLDILPHPGYARNKYLYVSYVASNPALVPIQDRRYMQQTYNYGATLRVLRFVDTGHGLADAVKIFEGDPAELDIEPGGRMTFGPDGKLYLMYGNFSHGTFDAQHLDSLKGKILRLNPDGSIPADNPFAGRSDARPEIFSLGHKNSYGLLFAPGTRELIEVSHGPTGAHFRPTGHDEINIVHAGKNYGWPIVFGQWGLEGMEGPAFLWRERPSMAPGGAVFYEGDAFHGWKGNLIVTGLASMSLLRFAVRGEIVALEEKIIAGEEYPVERRLGLRPMTGIGRLRGIAVGPDGFIYVGTSNAENADDPTQPIDRVVRVQPR
jgi:glucose/arabinose dehydrogenase